SYFYSDKYIVFATKAKPATKKEYFDYYTTTENLTIAAGIPMPKLYVIETEALNAFATGRNPKHALVCITTGLLNRLERSEIEAVISHELSHIKNYDILIASIVTILVGTLVLAVDFVSRGWMYGRFGRDNRSSSYLTVILFLIVIILAPLLATLIQLAISRKREYLADASGALLTRNPDSLAKALEKMDIDSQPMKSASGATAHLFITNPLKTKNVKSKIAGLFSTHPPIKERIRILRLM
ncbi:MAG: M48 family metallopeptidase, partial [Patescibacteria group bacterium]